MKRTLLTLFISCFTLISIAQSVRSIDRNEWLFSVGLNTVNSLGTRNPVEGIGDWGYRFPITFGFETKWFDVFSIEAVFSVNGVAANQRLDAAGPPKEDLTYVAIDTNLKYYFGEYIFPRTDWLDFYVAGGVGLFVFDDTNMSFNFGGGATLWLNRRKTIGFKPQAMAKFGLNSSKESYEYPNNHFQYSLMAVFVL
ncbi:hypothetical protein [Winogradskyella sp. SYSU M77433]|uniref:hypothetical protein n=1 Tax=Winogradskyella sp. SYSU M77433 TaxID=3042722 RepID=UPI00248176C6|nr:hypothetical protein [Winogradskyella sp. SYSU M77433]MDH7911538.1 hypothetical protein [Winogradskyella sp. SYSU M77433]